MKNLFWLLVICTLVSSPTEAAIKLFEDSTAFTNGFVQTEAVSSVINTDAHFGTRSIRIACPADSTSGQIHNESIPGWDYDIVENPQAANEVRWIMFAWKKIGPDGIMMQFATPDGWGINVQPEVMPPSPVFRYFSGTNFSAWSGVRTGWHAPPGWQLVIRDLYADFGSFTMTGIALTPYNGVGLYDSIYIAKTYSDLLTAFQPANTIVRVLCPEKVNDGEYFNVDITISDAVNVSGYSFTIHYNHDIIKAEKVTEGGFLKSQSPTYWLKPDIDNSSNIIHEIVCVTTTPGGVSGSGTLLTVNFRAKDDGESPITIQNLAVSDANGQLFPVAVENGSVLVDDFPAWDVNGDGRVCLIDFIIVGQNFGKHMPSGTEPNPDVNRNGVVDLLDWILMAAHYGEVYWDGAPGLEAIPPASLKPLFENMLDKLTAMDKPDDTAIAVTQSLIDRCGKRQVSSWGRIKSE